MNAVPSSSANGYGSNVVRTARDAEYDVFSRVTRMLLQADETGYGPDRIAAVDKNNQLWTILASDLADPGNTLPDQVRAGLLSLAGFSLRHGHQALAGKVSLAPLIDINMAMMRGLRQEAVA
ncbi:flagellar biosynthesis regulatory protein FlaF [Paracoccus acridae]|uniref:Flagellar biosynthesis regulatory protein FlaF n=1 Tax=Paracoccus acridae TaxID=1795310 RepID=A0ABQ1VGI3_9RHOB|nr:flagellar biosynthesis regulator FlaF [Paracoccus acridae]GGF61329.1 flagellar biosynthesis regulatory protein FlaF [Paracoccus acridae]